MKSHRSRAVLIHCGLCPHERKMRTRISHGRLLSGECWVFRLRSEAGSDPTRCLERAQPCPTLIMDSYPPPWRPCGPVSESPGCFSTPCKHTGHPFLIRMVSSLPVLKAVGRHHFLPRPGHAVVCPGMPPALSHPALVLWGVQTYLPGLPRAMES